MLGGALKLRVAASMAVKKRRGKDPDKTERPTQVRIKPPYMGWRARPYTPLVVSTLSSVGFGNGEIESPSFNTEAPASRRPSQDATPPIGTTTRFCMRGSAGEEGEGQTAECDAS